MKNTGKLAVFMASIICFYTFSYGQRYIDNAIYRPNDKQELRLGLRGGFNISNLVTCKGLDIWNGLAYFNKDSEYIGFTNTRSKYSYQGGIEAQYQMSDYWYWQAGLVYTNKGYELKTQDVEIDATAAYMQIPIEVVYKYPAGGIKLLASLGAFLGVGVYGYTQFWDHYGESDEPRSFHQDIKQPVIKEDLGYYNLIGFDRTVHGNNVYWGDRDATFLTEGTYKIDAGLQAGLGVEFWRFQLMLSYQYSLTPFYNFGHDFSGRYQRNHMNYSTSFEFFGIDRPASPHQHLISISLIYFFDNWHHGLKI